MHNFKTTGKALVIAAVFVLILAGLDMALYPCTFMRNDIHTVTTWQRDDIILGTSHGKMGIDPESMEEITGRTGHNLCVGSEYCEDAYYLLKLIQEKQAPSRVIYEIDPGYFVTEKQEGNNYLLFFHEFPFSAAKLQYFWSSIASCNFRTILFPWYEYSLKLELERAKETFSQKWNHDYDVEKLKSDTQEYHENGFIARYPVNVSKLKKPSDPKLFDSSALNQENMEYLEKLIRYCKDQGIEFVAVTAPMPQVTLKDYKDNFNEAWKYFSDFFESQDVLYLNFNTGYYKAFPHDMKYFTDFDGHLNADAARNFSKVLAKILMEKGIEK